MSVFFQAHRGGYREVPEHTIESYHYAWALGGLPEADIRTTKDDVIFCLHDDTLARTTDAPDSIKDIDVSELTFDEIRALDAGIYFGPDYAVRKVPSLAEVFGELQKHPKYQLYLDLKKVNLESLGKLIDEYGVADRIIFAHNLHESLINFRKYAPEVRTMLWIGGTADEIKGKFDAALQSGFRELNQVQLHLRRIADEQDIMYELDGQYLKYALKTTRDAGLDLEVLPWEYNESSIHHLLDLGIRWYAVNGPKRFTDTVAEWMNK